MRVCGGGVRDGATTGHGTGGLRGHGVPDGQTEGGWGGSGVRVRVRVSGEG